MRAVIAESARFPELAEAAYRSPVGHIETVVVRDPNWATAHQHWTFHCIATLYQRRILGTNNAGVLHSSRPVRQVTLVLKAGSATVSSAST
jgi:hypothetical protein